MKKIVGLLILAVFAVTAAFAVKPNFTAKVEKREGIYIYINAEPTEVYEELGFLRKKGLWWSGHYDEMRNFFLKKCKKEYPNANAMILFLSGEGGRATAIRVLDIEDRKEPEQTAK